MKFRLISKIILFFLLIISLTSCQPNKKGFVYNLKDPKIALVLSGPVNDSSWNIAAYQGIKRFQSDHKTIDISIVEKVSPSDSYAVFNQLAKKGYSLVIGHGFRYSNIIKNVARNNPQTFFALVGGELAQEPNLCSFNFKDVQYGYLLGIVAGLNTSTNKVGIVVGKKLCILFVSHAIVDQY